MPTGIYKRTNEHNKMISEALKRVHKNTSSGYNSPEVRKRISESMKEERKNPNSIFNTIEHRKKQSDKSKARKPSKKSIKNMSESRKEYYKTHEHYMKGKTAHNKGKTYDEYVSPEKIISYKKKISESTKHAWIDKESGFNTKKHKKYMSERGKLLFHKRLEESPYYWYDVPFASKMEYECAKLLLKRPIYGVNCHISFGNKVVDFFPQKNDLLFKGCFVEFHPCPQYGDRRTTEEYYEDRFNIIKNSKYKNIPLVLINNIKNISKTKENTETT